MTTASAPPTSDERRTRLGGGLERFGLVAALAPVLLKGSVAISAFPGWELDPFTFPSEPSAFGPTGAMLCDAITAIGVILLLIGRWLRGVSLPLIPTVLFVGGAAGVLVTPHTVADMWIGSSWFAAMLLGLAVSTLPRDEQGERLRSLIGAVFLGFVAMLAVRGVQQVFIEHPQTVADFRRNREAIFAAQGWTLDSPMAKAYERRLLQPEATGWFGLANVYATFAAAGTVLALAMLAGTIRERHSGKAGLQGRLVGSAAALAAGATALGLAGGKGGYMAAAVGVAAALALVVIRSRVNGAARPGRAAIAGGLLGVLALVAVFALILARGVIGDRLNELSLLFRWFYMDAAIRIGLDNLPFGVGPDGFQNAYMLAKNPLSPEEVTSSHNLLLDWFATLGVFGLAWCCLWIWWVWRAGAAAVVGVEEPRETAGDCAEQLRRDRWTLVLIGAIVVVIGVRIDQNMLTPDLAMTRLIGLAAFGVVGCLSLRAFRESGRTMRLAVTAAAIAAAAHALIDVTGVWPGSAGLLCMLVAVAAAPAVPAVVAARKWRGTVMIGVLAMLVLPNAPTIMRVGLWEAWLRQAAIEAGEAGKRRQEWESIVTDLRAGRSGARETAQAFAESLGVRELSPDAVERGLSEDDLNRTRRVNLYFEKLLMFKQEWKARREASRVKMREASLLRALGEPDEALDAQLQAEKIMTDVPAGDRTAPELAWLSLVRESLASVTGDAAWRAGAIQALEDASKLAPYDLEYAKRLARLYGEMGDGARAREWAVRALELDAGMKFDREVKGLSSREREEITRVKDGI